MPRKFQAIKICEWPVATGSKIDGTTKKPPGRMAPAVAFLVRRCGYWPLPPPMPPGMLPPGMPLGMANFW